MVDQGKARDEGIERAARANAFWRENAEACLQRVARRQSSLTSDDVWEDLQRWGIHPPPEPRAMGAVMRHGESAGWIERTDATRVSPNPSTPNHRRPQRVYQSTSYAGKPETQVPEPAPVSVAPSAPQGPSEGLFETIEEPVVPPLHPGDYACSKVESSEKKKEVCLRPLTHLYGTRFDSRYVEGNCPKHGRVIGSLSKTGAPPTGWGTRLAPAPVTRKPRAYRKRKTG
jgi:hypothetical protein